MLGKYLAELHSAAPRIHCITNRVTINDCANMLLACGASPIMADDPDEAAEITSVCGGLCINIGTLDRRLIPSMLASGQTAMRLGIPAVLDPVGAGASQFRTNTALKLLENIRFSVIRGNLSEIKALTLGCPNQSGVDAAECDRMSGELDRAAEYARRFAERTGAVVAVTGAVDIITDGKRAYRIDNGNPMMSRVTGTGCQLSALTAAFAASCRKDILHASIAAAAAMGLCGELAAGRMGALDGNASYRNYIIDAMFNLTPERLDAGERIGIHEMR